MIKNNSNNHFFCTFQKRGWLMLTCIGLNYIWDLKIPVLLSLFCLPTLKAGLEGFYDFCWIPIEDVVSYVWFNCHLFWWVGSLGPFGTDHLGLFCVFEVLELFYGWYDPGPTISEVEFNKIKGSNPFTALLAYKLNCGTFGISGFKFGLY